MRTIWFQAAHAPDAEQGKRWVVLQMWGYPTLGKVSCMVVSHWPTRHEAEGHARKEWEKLQ